MSKAAGGLRERRRRDVLELLARARPASLDQGVAGLPPEDVAARLAAAHGAPGAGPAREKPSGRHLRRGLLAGAGLTVTAAAAATAVLVATAGGGVARPARHAAGPVLLTAATVQRLAAVSRSALATSGRAVVTYSTTQNGALQDAGTDDITFSGKNWNDSISQTFPGPGGRPGHRQVAINRIVNGQFYLYIAGRARRLQWYHDTNPSGHPSFTIPDPRTLLRALAPSARFVAAGYQVIGGMRLKELRATDLSHVTGLGVLADIAPIGRVTSLEVWADGHGVVRRMALTSVQTSLVYPAWAYNVRRRADGTMIVTVPNKALAASIRAKLKKASGVAGRPRMVIHIVRAGSAPPRRQSQANAVTVSFSGIGQPQRITAPRHPIQQFGRG